MSLEFHLRLAGGLLILLALAHLFMPRHFQWHQELAGVSLLTRQVFWVHTFFVCLVLVMMGALSLCATADLLKPSPLACYVLGGFAFFWFLRLVMQWCVYDRRLWQGQRFNTCMHALFTCLWTYLVAIYGTAFWRQCCLD
ncbi:MAG: hypothetical protein O3B24_10075 [Verrucomicrobia bacterium]|nr:hypothetical protein [Verrucomicrobiota bacterium]